MFSVFCPNAHSECVKVYEMFNKHFKGNISFVNHGCIIRIRSEKCIRVLFTYDVKLNTITATLNYYDSTGMFNGGTVKADKFVELKNKIITDGWHIY